jgi:sugar-specific transcriptional regulator TrmB
MTENRADEASEAENQIPAEHLEVASEVSPQTLSKIKDILDALAHEDAIKIFNYAKDGITNSTVAIRDLGLTQKRYYTRLKLLLDAGILEKWEQGYRYTFLGEVLHQMSGSFTAVLEQKDRLELASKLRKTKSLSEEEKKNLMTLIVPTGSGGFLNLSEMINPVRMIDNYEELIKNMIELIDQTKESICLVSKYGDIRVVEALTRVLQQGIKIRALGPKLDISNRINMIRTLLSPKTLTVFIKAAKDLSHMVRQTNVSYSFIILDEKLAIFELPHPTKDTFYLGFIIQNMDVCRKLITIFNDMWEKAENASLL